MKVFVLIFSLMINVPAYATPSRPSLTLISEQAGIHITTTKVARLYGPVEPKLYERFKKDMEATQSVPGDRVILINSPGGEVEVGNRMLDLMKAEQKQGTRIVCFAFNSAHSMAFNILTNCDVRIMAPDTMAIVHKVARGGVIAERMTAKVLREIADDLDKTDEPFKQANAKAMHLTLKEYDTYADAETYWRAETLLNIKYLQGIGYVEK